MIAKTVYRDAMARMGAAVNVITSDGPAGRCGCTASAVCGVTDQPPMLLVCINRSSRNNTAFKENSRLCVNVLDASQQALALRFASKDMAVDERFSEGDWDVLETGSPVLRGAAVSLDCDITFTAEVGTHTVFYCAVRSATSLENSEALIYFDRGFHRVGRATHAVGA
ncbi:MULTISPECIES: flavin reductase [unclassified Achromobacter]|uniref:flavin reductase n=1 Tax=unclassified Achromobacter TaxID=2626865 RepID=UPI000B51DFD4|nr:MULTISPECIES: flavin reductase [unclassified Achromobacter]OWT71624.1 flavin reductase [Achromobacter sp. HZ34]OWT73281.1 flavin reductase [Achromobacter sp. HZ28]